MYYATLTAAEAVRRELFGPAGRRRANGGRRLRLAAAFGIVALAVLVAGCSAGAALVESPVTEAEAVAMAENALLAFNADDYTAWSRDWSATMKAAIGEDAFHGFRDEFHAMLGDYQAIVDAEGGQGANSGTYRWTFDVDFEQGPYQLVLGFKEGSPLIEGVRFLESTT